MGRAIRLPVAERRADESGRVDRPSDKNAESRLCANHFTFPRPANVACALIPVGCLTDLGISQLRHGNRSLTVAAR